MIYFVKAKKSKGGKNMKMSNRFESPIKIKYNFFTYSSVMPSGVYIL